MAVPNCNPFAYSATAGIGYRPNDWGGLSWAQINALPPCQNNYTAPTGGATREQTGGPVWENGQRPTPGKTELTQAQLEICRKAGISTGREDGSTADCSAFLKSKQAAECVAKPENCKSAGDSFKAETMAANSAISSPENPLISWAKSYWWILLLIFALVAFAVWYFA